MLWLLAHVDYALPRVPGRPKPMHNLDQEFELYRKPHVLTLHPHDVGRITRG